MGRFLGPVFDPLFFDQSSTLADDFTKKRDFGCVTTHGFGQNAKNPFFHIPV